LKHPLYSQAYDFVKPLVCCCTKLWCDRQKRTSEMKSTPWN